MAGGPEEGKGDEKHLLQWLKGPLATPLSLGSSGRVHK